MSAIKVLIAAIHYPVASGRYIAHAFRKLGHEVKTVGPCTGTDIWGVKVHERYVWTPDNVDNYAPPQGFAWLRRRKQ